MEECFWHFPLTKPEAEWSEFDRDLVDLMRTAYAEGYQPRQGQCGCIDLGQWPQGRSVSLVREAAAMVGSRSSAMRIARSGWVRVMAYRWGRTPVCASVRRSEVRAHLRWSGCGAVLSIRYWANSSSWAAHRPASCCDRM